MGQEEIQVERETSEGQPEEGTGFLNIDLKITQKSECFRALLLLCLTKSFKYIRIPSDENWILMSLGLTGEILALFFAVGRLN